MDNDDLLIDNALETLYNLAEEYQADVLYMERFFLCNEKIIPEAFNPVEWMPDLSDEEVLLESGSLDERMKKFLGSRFLCSPWSKFLARKLLIDNAITLPQMRIADDIFWTFKILCLAKKILRIPARVYVHRNNMLSVSKQKRSPEKYMELHASPLTTALELFENFMSGIEFFKRNPELRLKVLMFFIEILLKGTDAELRKLRPAEVYEIFLREFTKAGSSHPALIACLFVMSNIYLQTLKERDKS